MTTTIRSTATDSPALKEQAEAIGREHGRSAARRQFSGASAFVCEWALEAIDNGHMSVYMVYRAPDLSGDYRRANLMRALGGRRLDRIDRDYLCAMYSSAASGGFWTEIQRIARDHLA